MERQRIREKEIAGTEILQFRDLDLLVAKTTFLSLAGHYAQRKKPLMDHVSWPKLNTGVGGWEKRKSGLNRRICKHNEARLSL